MRCLRGKADVEKNATCELCPAKYHQCSSCGGTWEYYLCSETCLAMWEWAMMCSFYDFEEWEEEQEMIQSA